MQTANQTMEIIKTTPTNQIAELEFVRKKFIQNYNACNQGNMGDLIYARNLAHFKQIMMASDDLRSTEPFSVYACLMTIAVNGYSIDPSDNEVYLIPRKGKMCIQKQGPAYIKRLQRTGQIAFADNAILVYDGDDYEVSRGKVIKHIEKFKSDKIIAGYIIFSLTDGIERHITYRPSDWETWRQSSPQMDGSNWRYGNTGQPKPGFLKTKIVSHACNEKCWASGRNPATVEVFESVEIEEDDFDNDIPKTSFAAKNLPVNSIPPITSHTELKDNAAVKNTSFDEDTAFETVNEESSGQQFDDENF